MMHLLSCDPGPPEVAFCIRQDRSLNHSLPTFGSNKLSVTAINNDGFLSRGSSSHVHSTQNDNDTKTDKDWYDNGDLPILAIRARLGIAVSIHDTSNLGTLNIHASIAAFHSTFDSLEIRASSVVSNLHLFINYISCHWVAVVHVWQDSGSKRSSIRLVARRWIFLVGIPEHSLHQRNNHQVLNLLLDAASILTQSQEEHITTLFKQTEHFLVHHGVAVTVACSHLRAKFICNAVHQDSGAASILPL
mmetsp:Transcript_49494/g.73749  ORF Transcript_49494/g.73749 Transcript_49494/m.73749 type:complete len:247 (-) Transcript_49494:919-1659(-)